LKIKYDPNADAIYIQFQDGKYETSKEIEEDIILDYTTEGKVLGIEILNISQKMDPKDIDEITVLIPNIRKIL
jgi:uncharacterized protein YuzE